jgi:hypothetical protein
VAIDYFATGGMAMKKTLGLLIGMIAFVSGSGAFAKDPPEACSLATAEDLTATLGRAFTPCAHKPNGGVTLLVRTETLDKSGFEQSRKDAPNPQDVAGLGDAAFFFVLGTNNLFVFKGTTKLGIFYSGGKDKAEALAAEKALAKRLLPKL